MLYQIYKKKIAYFENNRKNKFEIFFNSQSSLGNDAKEKTRIVKKKVTTEMSSSMKRAEMEHVNPSFQKIMKRGIVRDNLILEELFFLFDLSRIYLPG